MLLREDFRGSHQSDLIPVLHGNDGSLEGNDGFAGTDISLEKSPHGSRLLHVRSDLLKHSFLSGCRMERQDLLDSRSNLLV